jgi:serine/threonine protein kinase
MPRMIAGDLGMAKLLEAAAHSIPPDTAAGTFGNLPPEQIKGKAQTHSVDIFSIGIMAMELAHGKSPLQGRQQWASPGVPDPAAMKHLKKWLKRTDVVGMTSELREFCAKLCHKEATERPTAFAALSDPYIMGLL